MFKKDTDPRCAFRTILSLICLVAAINNHSHPNLAKPSEPYPPLCGPQASDLGPSDHHNHVLNTISHLLVRRSDIVAITPFNPLSRDPKLSVQAQMDMNPYRSETDPHNSDSRINNDQWSDVDDDDDGIQNIDGTQNLLNIAIVANPHDED